MADTRSKEGSFQWAIKTGDLKGVQDYIEKEKIDLNKPDTTVKKRTPLHYAADFGQVEVIKLLLTKGAKIEVKDGFGITPLLAAVYEGHEDAVAFLLSKGASTNVKGPDGLTPLEAAESQSMKDLLKGKK
eukprot:TRINITY_DN9983_c0_g1_i1.p1 TRINITY_DN9983_c0_g1~~TRINITY_DN9983_c0_g1_i1.p1  ORF type:complete len:130 (+),score=44.47 TRINITY_DN9983_c0_g1_i1:73-462(+)